MKTHAILASLMLALASCGSGSAGSAPNATLADLEKIDDLSTRFDADAGSVRLVLLMSPT